MNSTLLQILMVSAAVKNISNNILKTSKESSEFKPQKTLIKCNPIYLCYETEDVDLPKAKNINISIFKRPCQAITGFNIHPDFTPDCHKKARVLNLRSILIIKPIKYKLISSIIKFLGTVWIITK